MNKFSITEFKKHTDFKVEKSKFSKKEKELVKEMQVIYVDSDDDFFRYLRIWDGEFHKKNNCINVYCGESSKFGYWWDGNIDYVEFNKFLKELKKEFN